MSGQTELEHKLNILRVLQEHKKLEVLSTAHEQMSLAAKKRLDQRVLEIKSILHRSEIVEPMLGFMMSCVFITVISGCI